jgi:hypothetical protein
MYRAESPVFNDRYGIPRLILQVAPGPGQAARLADLAGEVAQLAEEVILDVANVPDECLERVAAFVAAVSANSSVKICGLQASQIRQLFDLGVDPRVILVGRLKAY